MANAAERLFDSVLSTLRPVQDPDWNDDQTIDPESDEQIDGPFGPFDSLEDGIFTIDEEHVDADPILTTCAD